MVGGVTPTFETGTVTTLDAGSEATVELGGTAPNYVINLGVPKGANGLPGADADPTLLIATDENSQEVNKTLSAEVINRKLGAVNADLTTDESVIENSPNPVSGGAVFNDLTPINNKLIAITNSGQITGFTVKTQAEYDALPSSKTTVWH